MEILADITEQDFNADGEIPQGFLFASIKNVGDQTADVNGVALEPGEAKSYPFVGKGYGAIPYTVNGSILRILHVI